MNKLAFLLAGAAALALSACDDAVDTDDTAVVETATTLPAPVVTETTVVGEGDLDGGDSVTIDEDGVEVDVDDGDTEVEADIDEDPGVTVRD